MSASALYQIDNLYPLTAEFARLKPNVKHIVGTAGTSKRRYLCRFCGTLVDTDGGSWRMTKHALKAANSHAGMHEEELIQAAKLLVEYERAFAQLCETSRPGTVAWDHIDSVQE